MDDYQCEDDEDLGYFEGVAEIEIWKKKGQSGSGGGGKRKNKKKKKAARLEQLA